MGKTETMAINNRKYSMTPIQLFKKNQKNWQSFSQTDKEENKELN